MRYRWMFGVAWWVVGCGSSAAGEDGAAMTSTGSTAAAASTSDTSEGDDTAGPAGTGSPMTSSAGSDGTGSATSSVDDAGFPVTGGPGSVCVNDEIELANVSIVFTTHRVSGEDVAATFDPARGDWACVDISGGVRLRVQFGPPMFSEPQLLSLEVYDGVRLYDLAVDLAVDPGPPGSGDPGLVGFGYTVPIAPAGVANYDTINQAATGALDVIALPIRGSVDMEFAAAGEIAGPNGWEFDLHFSGVVPVR